MPVGAAPYPNPARRRPNDDEWGERPLLRAAFFFAMRPSRFSFLFTQKWNLSHSAVISTGRASLKAGIATRRRVGLPQPDRFSGEPCSTPAAPDAGCACFDATARRSTELPQKDPRQPSDPPRSPAPKALRSVGAPPAAAAAASATDFTSVRGRGAFS